MKFVCNKVENIVRKEENSGYQHFLLFLQYFLPFPNKFQFFIYIFVVCKCFWFETVWKFVVSYFVVCIWFQFWPV